MDAKPDDQYLKISEWLHTKAIPQLRILLGQALHDKQQVMILIDNLDDPWQRDQNIGYLADLLRGLLRVSNDVIHDFARRDSRTLAINTTISIFIRSDIFYHVLQDAVEQDKLPIRLISWQDEESLMQIVDARL